MSIQVKRRREAWSFLSTFIGAAGEILFDTTNNRLRAQDGVTAGGWSPLGLSPATLVEGHDGSNVPHGGGIAIGCLEQLVTLSGATTASTIAFPNPCLVIGASLRIVTAVTGSGVTGFTVGRTGGTVNEFGTIGSLSAGTTNAGLLGNPNGNYASTTVTFTATGGSFSGGTVRLQLAYMLLNPPTS